MSTYRRAGTVINLVPNAKDVPPIPIAIAADTEWAEILVNRLNVMDKLNDHVKNEGNK